MLDNFIKKLEGLKPDQKALWGKMTARHMVEHLIFTVQMSNGKLKVQCSNPPEKLVVLKNFLLSSRPFPKLFVNPVIGTELVILKYADIEEAEKKLKEELLDYNTCFIQNPDAKLTHMIFGELNKEEWDIVHRKHFTHHLAQFGLIE
jgi:hypothetical protein